jgi:hypothetical protein
MNVPSSGIDGLRSRGKGREFLAPFDEVDPEAPSAESCALRFLDASISIREKSSNRRAKKMKLDAVLDPPLKRPGIAKSATIRTHHLSMNFFFI